MTTSLQVARMRDYFRNSWRVLLKEISAFGAIGIVAFVIDVGIFTWLAPGGALKAKCVSTVVATTFAYIGNRYLSFSHRARTSIKRETAFFFGINFVALVFSELCLAFFVYALGYDHGGRVVAVVNIVTIIIG